MGPFFDDEQLKLDFFGKQAIDREEQAYPKSSSKQALAIDNDDTQHLKKQKKIKQRDPSEKMMVNNFMIDDNVVNEAESPSAR